MNGPRGPTAASLHTFNLRRYATAVDRPRDNGRAKKTLYNVYVICNDATKVIIRDLRIRSACARMHTLFTHRDATTTTTTTTTHTRTHTHTHARKCAHESEDSTHVNFVHGSQATFT